MEGSTDSLCVENKAVASAGEVGQPGRAKENTVLMDQPAPPKEPPPEMDSGPGGEVCSPEEDRSCHSASAEGPATSQLGAPEDSASLQPPTPVMSHSRPSDVSLAEMDCLVCFNRYSPGRRPKLLACQHAFCAVCLKLILWNQGQTWLITCPLCRKPTVVFGGLVCSLRDKEDLLGRLESPGPGAEVPCPPDFPSLADPCPVSQNQEDASRGDNRAAAKRLVLLLLLLAMLIVLILPFMYTGLLKWALCFVAALGLLMSAVLCCNPGWECSCCPLPPWRKKEGQLASVA
ncbi:E3 ubiquitin-protein ligase RNF186-like [Hemicordylus capensis]|uniref:E3 ubiquitin-protein ligase RNF186-like n=1 Tax=Hemicordylus capensis TaxID=884348 RepID=UPI002303FC22|nr:E3 ubiquitin-protein ligase RNF186-like [Hemicordylus capensis]